MRTKTRGTLRLIGGYRSSGQPVYEQVLVKTLDSGRFQVLCSPGLVPGIAKGDTLELQEGSGGEFRIIERGGNLCIQIFSNEPKRLAATFTSRVEEIGGSCDGISERQVVFAVPVKAGFSNVEAILEDLLRRFPESEWYYGNVYDPRDGQTPLNWWL